MLKQRKIFYLVLLNMVINVMAYVPNILIKHRFDGSLMSMLISIPLGTIFMYIFSVSFNKFNEMGLPEILDTNIPRIIRNIILFFYAVMYFWGGTIFLLSLLNLTRRFINPDLTEFQIYFVYILFIIWATRLKTAKILNALEIILLLNIPSIFWIIYKAYSNEYFTLNSILQVGTYIYETPKWSTLSSSVFIFSGYSCLLIFNRVLKGEMNTRWIWSYSLIGTMILITTFFVPIALHGSIGVGDYTFPWSATADSIRMEFGPVERVLYIFLLLYISITIVSIIIQWHVSLELLKGIMPKSSDRKGKLRYEWVILFFFGGIVYFLEINMNEQQLLDFGELFLNVRLPSEVLLVILLFLLARRKNY